jgi:hypothetical protein
MKILNKRGERGYLCFRQQFTENQSVLKLHVPVSYSYQFHSQREITQIILQINEPLLNFLLCPKNIFKWNFSKWLIFNIGYFHLLVILLILCKIKYIL